MMRMELLPRNGVKTLLVLGLLSPLAVAQPPQENHPRTTDCNAYGCYVNWLCAPSLDLCVECPHAFMGTTEDHCRSLFVLGNATTTEDNDAYYYTNETAWEMDLTSCLEVCIKPRGGDACTDDTGGCDPGRFFCNYQPTEEVIGDDAPIVKEGICEPCKEDIRECLDDPSILSPFGVEDCVLCDIGVCIPLHYSLTEEIRQQGGDTLVLSEALEGSPRAVVEGPIVSCNNLIHRPEETCVWGGNDLSQEERSVKGKICLVHDYTKNSYFVSVVNKCAALGGIGVVFFQENLSRVPNNQTWPGSLSYLPTTIPSVVVPYDTGIKWEEEWLGQDIRINVTDVGTVCGQIQFCNDDIPCVGSKAGQYCDYKWGGGNGGNGYCRECPTDEDGNDDPLQCFFNTPALEDDGKIMGESGALSCSDTCASELTFPSCKFCPEDVSGFDFGLEKESDEKCRFCQENDVLYPDKNFTLFGEGVKCWMVQKFFDSVEVPVDARNCELAQMMNYVCGCSGSGYLGADTEAKQKVLAWLPRIMAILSFFGSSFIIYDTAKSPEQRRKVMNQLLIGLSVFDLMGSAAYAFTTLPIPENHEYGPIYGAKGNEATCTAQGWFIQIGTISAYINVSLAIYYLLVIKYSWNEEKLKKIRWILFLVPMAVGFAFAFAGIPYYDSLNLWCNNTASYWPDIPVAVAIGLATIIMAAVCWDVYSKERAAAKWRGAAAFHQSVNKSQQEQGTVKSSLLSRMSRMSSMGSEPKPTAQAGPARQTLSNRVFWQSFFYLMSFYLTWPPYLALQYAWAGGSSFTNYGLILTAATLVPLQGFWNMLVYIRPRYVNKSLEKLRERRRSRTRPTTQSKEGGSRLSWLTRSKKYSKATSDSKATSNDNPGSSDNNHASSGDMLPVFSPSSGQEEVTSTQERSANYPEASFQEDKGEEEKQEE